MMLFAIFFLLGSLSAEFSIDADELIYQGANGMMEASDVTLTLKTGAKLTTPHALLDFKGQFAKVTSGSTEDVVVYSGFVDAISLLVKAREMVLMPGEAREGVEIQAAHGVEIHYAEAFTAYGDRAVFQSEERSLENLSPKTILLEGGDLSHLARVEHVGGGEVQAMRFSLNPADEQIVAWMVQGHAPTREGFSFVSFKAMQTKLNWEEGFLTLQEGVEIQDEEIGILKSKGKVEMNAPEMHFKALYTQGETEIQSKSGLKVVSFGELFLDHEQKKVLIDSPTDRKKEQQCYLEDSLGKLYADHMELHYSEKEGNHTPDKVLLEGHVRLHTHYIPTLGAFVEQYAVADRVEYHPKTKEMRLSSDTGKRVLFVDKGRGIQMSAPAINILRGVGEAMEIKGLGTVRMKLNPNEMNELELLFPFLK